MTPSIEERHEVAEKLRKTRGLHACNKDLIELELSERIGAFRKNGMSWDYICDRLADLINPEPWANTMEDNHRLLDRCRELERENARLKAHMGGAVAGPGGRSDILSERSGKMLSMK